MAHQLVDALTDDEEVDDRYFDKPYYLLPGAGGEKEGAQSSGRAFQ